MKRREFVRHSTLGALGVSLFVPDGAIAETGVTHLTSEDLSPQAALATKFPVNFMALGDWGRNGEYLQLEVGKQMGQWALENRNDFVISTGDNFYPKGVVSEHDPLWHFSFENVYTAHALQCNWYPVLGNHDYGADPDAQVRYSKISRRWNMPSRYYSKEVSLGKEKGKALFLMIDTNPMVDEDQKKQTEKQLTWIKKTLQKAPVDVKWKIITGHHPCYTVGPRIKNDDILTVRNLLTPIFEEHKVDVYLAGHEHSLQHLKPEGYTHQFISGAGSSLTGVTTGIAYSRFEASRNGFLYFSMDSTQMIVKAIDEAGKVMYQTEIKK